MHKLFGLIAMGLTLLFGNAASALPPECCTGTIVCAGHDKCLDCPRGTRSTNGTTASGYQYSHCAVSLASAGGNKSADHWADAEDADAAVSAGAANENAADDAQENELGEEDDGKAPSAGACSVDSALASGSAAGLLTVVPVLAALMRRRRRH